MGQATAGFTLIDLLIFMFLELCSMLLDVLIRRCLGIPIADMAILPAFFLGFFLCAAISFYLDTKHAGPRVTRTVLAIPFCSALASVFLAHWKDRSYLIDFAFGFYVPVLWWFTMLLLSIAFNPFPTCKAGKCDGRRDYTIAESSRYGSKNRPVDGSVEYNCRCGDAYLRCGKQFMALDSERARHPYKKLIGFHKWADDLDQ